jgi:hypothetical protein
VDAPHASGGLEKHLVRCEACGDGFLLTYGRSNVSERFQGQVITSVSVRCPWRECRHLQVVLVPLNAQEIRTAQWLGGSAPVRSQMTLRDALGSAPSCEPDAHEEAQRSMAQRKGVKLAPPRASHRPTPEPSPVVRQGLPGALGRWIRRLGGES